MERWTPNRNSKDITKKDFFSSSNSYPFSTKYYYIICWMYMFSVIHKEEVITAKSFTTSNLTYWFALTLSIDLVIIYIYIFFCSSNNNKKIQVWNVISLAFHTPHEGCAFLACWLLPNYSTSKKVILLITLVIDWYTAVFSGVSDCKCIKLLRKMNQ